MGVFRGCPKFESTSYYLRNGNSYELLISYAFSYNPPQQKPINNFSNSSHGRSQGLSKLSRPCTCRAHRAVTFAIAWLSCFLMVNHESMIEVDDWFHPCLAFLGLIWQHKYNTHSIYQPKLVATLSCCCLHYYYSTLFDKFGIWRVNIKSKLCAMDHIAHVFGMEEIVGHILKFLPMKELHRLARYYIEWEITRRANLRNWNWHAQCRMLN